MKKVFRSLPIGLVLLLAGCSSTYYNTMEKFGIAKREILADRVDDTRKSQEDAKVQFADALQQFLALTQVDGGNLQRKYESLNTQFKRSEARAKEVRDRIASVENVAEALFREWKQELAQYSNPTLRSESQRQLDTTRQRYETLVDLMRRAAERMDPIIATFRDQVLFLKHNLNASAIASLGTTQRTLEADISRLISDMETSIREAERFIKDLKTGT